MDLKLGSNRDILFVNGECPVTKEKSDVVAQRLLIRLRTFFGEWFLREDYGVPYMDVLGKKVTKSVVDLLIQEQIYKERGVSQITSFTSSLGANRVYQCAFQVRTTNGSETGEIVIP